MRATISQFLIHLPHRFWLWFSIVWTIALITLSLISVRKAAMFSIDVIGFDKIGHFIFYMVLTFSWLMTDNFIPSRKSLMIGAIIFFGIAIEFLQLNMGVGRAFEYYDMLANLLGTMVGVALFRAVQRVEM